MERCNFNNTHTPGYGYKGCPESAAAAVNVGITSGETVLLTAGYCDLPAMLLLVLLLALLACVLVPSILFRFVLALPCMEQWSVVQRPSLFCARCVWRFLCSRSQTPAHTVPYVLFTTSCSLTKHNRAPCAICQNLHRQFRAFFHANHSTEKWSNCRYLFCEKISLKKKREKNV